MFFEWWSLFIINILQAYNLNRDLEKTMATSKKNKTNKLGVKNSLVNNINAKKEKGASKSKSASTVSKKSYEDMENKWKDKK